MEFYIAFIIMISGCLSASWVITSRFLHFFQQEEYDNKRFLQWWIRRRSFEKRATLLALVFVLALWLSEKSAGISSLPISRVALLSLVIAGSIALTGRSNRPQSTKKALQMTMRAKRILGIALILQGLLFSGISALFSLTSLSPYYLVIMTLSCSLVFAAAPITLVLSNLLLFPLESSVQKRYLNEAREILHRFKPEIIGITGSYGKTSFKHILAHILESHASTLATPGSVNTLMGITRIIRERLRNDHAFFIVEMGAYGIGSIQRLCELTPPKTAIVTSIGLAHRERFKSIGAVRQAKSELPRALPNDGVAVLNGDDPHLRRMAEDLAAEICFYGKNSDQGRLDCRLIDAISSPNGLRCRLEYEGKDYEFELPLFGEHQAINAAGAFLAAARLGVAPITAVAALQSTPQIPHRLAVHRDAHGIITIDDAYNSNPVGFKNALDALQTLDGKRKILITPGMVELGGEADKAHRQLASHAAQSCDVIVLTAAHRLSSFREGLLESGFPPENLHEFSDLQSAQQWLNSHLRAGDVVLYENDLPDLYEIQTVFPLFE
ncbi:MAG: UDP-N-acetylmuramoyl-tripeptide--D-alanyl-D-alanine ligase [Candidatus Hinthialibacter sp.]